MTCAVALTWASWTPLPGRAQSRLGGLERILRGDELARGLLLLGLELGALSVDATDLLASRRVRAA